MAESLVATERQQLVSFDGGHRLGLALGAAAAATIVLSFVIQWITLTRLGPGLTTDAFFAALAVPQFVVAVVANPIAHVLVPLLAAERSRSVNEDVWAIFLIGAAGFGAITFVLAVSAGAWIPMTVAGFSVGGKVLALRLVLILLPGMAFIGTSTILRSVYQSRQQFIWPAISAVLAAVVGLSYLVWALPRAGVEAAAWSFTLRSATELVLMLPALPHPRRPSLRSELLPLFWGRIRPLLLGNTVERTDIVLDRLLASLAPSGGLSLLYLGQQVWGAAGQIVNRAVGDPARTALARRAARQEWLAFFTIYRTRLAVVFAITILCAASLALIGRPALEFVFGIRNMTDADVQLLWLLMLLLAGVLIGDPTSHLLLTSFYATGDTATPTKIGIVTYALGIALKLAGFWFFGIVGIAAGTSIYYLLRSSVLYVVMRRRIASALSAG